MTNKTTSEPSAKRIPFGTGYWWKRRQFRCVIIMELKTLYQKITSSYIWILNQITHHGLSITTILVSFWFFKFLFFDNDTEPRRVRYRRCVSQWKLVGDEREESLQIIQKCGEKSRYFQQLFLNAELWIRFDRKEFAKGESLIQNYLKKNPKNRIFFQALGDFYKRKGSHEQAMAIYQSSRKSYREVGQEFSVRDLSALGNLALLQKLSGRLQESAQSMNLFLEKLPNVRSKMPPSLQKDMEENGLDWNE